MGNIKGVNITTENSLVGNTNETTSMAGGKLYGGKLKARNSIIGKFEGGKYYGRK
jgi:hypothetical protein